MDEGNEIKQRIIDYLASPSHVKMTLATVKPEGKPLAHTVVYVADGATVYFRTRDSTRKVQNILNNPAVAYTVDEYPGDDWYQLEGVKMEGRATVLTDQADIDYAIELYVKKFSFVDSIVPLATPGLIFIKVEPVEGYFLDYHERLGHWDKVTF